MLLPDLTDEGLDIALGGLVECRGRLVEQQGLRRVRQGARKGDALRFASGQIRDVTRLESRESDPRQQFFDLSRAEVLSALFRSKLQIFSNLPGKQKRPLEDHANASSQLPRRNLPVVGAVDVDRPGGWFIQSVQQSQQRRLPGPARPHDGQGFALAHLEGRAADQDFSGYAAAQVFHTQYDRVGLAGFWQSHGSPGFCSKLDTCTLSAAIARSPADCVPPGTYRRGRASEHHKGQSGFRAGVGGGCAEKY